MIVHGIDRAIFSAAWKRRMDAKHWAQFAALVLFGVFVVGFLMGWVYG